MLSVVRDGLQLAISIDIRSLQILTNQPTQNNLLLPLINDCRYVPHDVVINSIYLTHSYWEQIKQLMFNLASSGKTTRSGVCYP
jgi:hypothetical protein